MLARTLKRGHQHAHTRILLLTPPIQHTSAHHQHTSAYVSIRQHMSAYVSIRQHAHTRIFLLTDAIFLVLSEKLGHELIWAESYYFVCRINKVHAVTLLL